MARYPPEEAVIQARVEADQEAERSEQVNAAVNKIMDTLRRNGYQPALCIEDVEVHGPEYLTGVTIAAGIGELAQTSAHHPTKSI